MKNLLRLSLFVLTLFGTTTLAHQGFTNHSGCHTDGSGYHCHTPYGQNTYTSYRCHTNPPIYYTRYRQNDPRSLTYSCNGGTRYNTYDNTYHYNRNKNYQTYYGTPTYHNEYRPQVWHKYYGKAFRVYSNGNPRYIYGNQLINIDKDTRYYSVPKHMPSATMRYYHTWPYSR